MVWASYIKHLSFNRFNTSTSLQKYSKFNFFINCFLISSQRITTIRSAGLALFLLLQLQDLCTFASTVLLHKSCAWGCGSEAVRHNQSVLREDIFPWVPSASCSFNLAQERKSDEEEEEEEEAVEKHRWLQSGLWTPHWTALTCALQSFSSHGFIFRSIC